ASGIESIRRRGNPEHKITGGSTLFAEGEGAPGIPGVGEGGELEILDGVVGVLERQRPFRGAAGVELEHQLLLDAGDEVVLLRLQLEHRPRSHQLVGERKLYETGGAVAVIGDEGRDRIARGK